MFLRLVSDSISTLKRQELSQIIILRILRTLCYNDALRPTQQQWIFVQVTLPETNIAHENPIFPGKYHQNGGFSMAMLVYRSVIGMIGPATYRTSYDVNLIVTLF